jgi:S-adenosylmethionine:tRNA ribosyltransferase-isomerase
MNLGIKKKLSSQMKSIQQINIGEYTYELPSDRIAKYPLPKRDESKLLVYRQGGIQQDVFKNINDYLPENSLLVSNDTRVINARLLFTKDTGACIEIFCLEPFLPSDYSRSFMQTNHCQWFCVIGNLKKWKEDVLTKKFIIKGESVEFSVKRISSNHDEHVVEFNWDNSNVTFGEILEFEGNIPIPPYLNREAEKSDMETYQTVYSKHQGSVAAPTAGLHFTPEVFNSLSVKNIRQHHITLHVGAGTFKPVKSQYIGNHDMHSEQFLISRDTIIPLINHLGNVTAVGTTTVRTLESLYWLGVKIITQGPPETNKLELGQWEVYKLKRDVPVADALNALVNYLPEPNNLKVVASTAIMIAPGYHFKMIDRLITNFHQPQSTLLLLIGALVGDDWKKIYQYAMHHQFRFLSYGDSCFLEPVLMNRRLPVGNL